MASPKLQRGRESRPGACYAITTVIHNRVALFNDPALVRVVADEMNSSLSETCTWVVMPEHVHWLLCLQSTTLSRCVQVFKSRTARAINLARGTTGKVWQAGFYDHQVRNDEDLRLQARFMVPNPVRRGLVARIEEYPHWWCPWICSTEDLIV